MPDYGLYEILDTTSLARLRCAPAHAADSAVRGAFLDYLDDPFYVDEEKAVRFVPDGLLVMSDAGKILAFGNYSDIAPKYPGVPITTYKQGNIIMPGFIDTHVHYVQSRVTGAYGLHKCAIRHFCTF